MPDHEPRPISIDVGGLVQRSVATLHSHLVTRPTGRAVRLAIETQIAESARAILSLIDFSEVAVLDFSCADEVVAKLLLRYLEEDRPKEAFFVLRGIRHLHRDPIQVALERQSLVTVAEVEDQGFELLGSTEGRESRVWEILEAHGRLSRKDVTRLLPEPEERETLDRLVERRVVFQSPEGEEFQALSTFVRDLA
jgi:hypothetical protein